LDVRRGRLNVGDELPAHVHSGRTLLKLKAGSPATPESP